MCQLWKPKRKILGMNFAGVVEDTGKDVRLFKKGDKVFGSTEFNFGTYAEYLKINEDSVITNIPSGISYEEASTVPFGTLTSLHFLRKGKIKNMFPELLQLRPAGSHLILCQSPAL